MRFLIDRVLVSECLSGIDLQCDIFIKWMVAKMESNLSKECGNKATALKRKKNTTVQSLVFG